MTVYIYAYTVRGQQEHWVRTGGHSGDYRIKVGQTTRKGLTRIRETLRTVYPNLDGVDVLFRDRVAVRPDGSDFGDADVHRVLQEHGIRRVGGEWFEATLYEVEGAVVALQTGLPFSPTRIQTFAMRPEQYRAVQQTAAYFRAHDESYAPRYLWNAKMRFGKTFTAYRLALEMGWQKVLVLTYKPAVKTAWRDDLLSHVDFAGWQFVGRATPVPEADEIASGPDPFVWFTSFQDLLGRDASGKVKRHNETVHMVDWDCIVIDEFHFGAGTVAARELYDPVDKKLASVEIPDVDGVVTDDDLDLKALAHLHLSGTPFRALTNGDYAEDEVYNWTYIDEQREKSNWDDVVGPNPYRDLPQMQMYTYRMDAEAEEWAQDGEFDGFNLNAYFKAQRRDDGVAEFLRPDQVAEFLKLIRGRKQVKDDIVEGSKPSFPYEAAKFAEAVRHSVWYMADVAACEAMADVLRTDNYFSAYEIIVAAGVNAGTGSDALIPVQGAIRSYADKGKSGTITLSCGKLMTGVTVPEWTSIFMLRALKSPESYFQAAFRVQSPWRQGGELKKETCYVFEFDPNRALGLLALYGTELATNDPTRTTTQREVLDELVNFLPIFAIDGGQMERLDVDAILDWANAGVTSTSLAKKWKSHQLFDLNTVTMSRLLDAPEVLEELEQIEDFRNIRDFAENMVTETDKLKKAMKEQKPKREVDKHQKNVTDTRKAVREKLRKISAKVLLFMYLTDFREEYFTHVIDSLDHDLFLRSTGLSLDGFRKLNEIGVFNLSQMDDAIRRFRHFEKKSLKVTGA